MKNTLSILVVLSPLLFGSVTIAQVLEFKIVPTIPAIPAVAAVPAVVAAPAGPGGIPPAVTAVPAVAAVLAVPETIGKIELKAQPAGLDLMAFNLKDIGNLQVKIEGIALVPSKIKLFLNIYGKNPVLDFPIPLTGGLTMSATGGTIKFNDPAMVQNFVSIVAHPEDFYLDVRVEYEKLSNSFKDIGKDKFHGQPKIAGTFKTSVEGVEIKGNEVYIKTTATDDQIAFAAYQYAIKRPQLTRPGRNGSRVILLDLRGRMLSNELKNVSQTERFIIRVIVPYGTEHNYDIRVDEGEYAPSDLAIRPFTPIAAFKSGSATSSKEDSKNADLIPMTFIEFSRGPYTTTNFAFSLLRTGGSGEAEEFGPFNIKINPIYHVGVGVSVVNSWLPDPSFELRSLGNNTNTIAEVNKGQRAFLTFNVVWYWRKSIAALFNSKNNPLDSEITQGRDILKEGGFWDRLNPTLGMSLTDKLFNNYFAGLTLEVARGLNIVGGIHYGRVTRFDDPNFSIGTTVFSGSVNEIPLTKVWKYDWSLGVMVDTRVFNLFTQNRQ